MGPMVGRKFHFPQRESTSQPFRPCNGCLDVRQRSIAYQVGFSSTAPDLYAEVPGSNLVVLSIRPG